MDATKDTRGRGRDNAKPGVPVLLRGGSAHDPPPMQIGSGSIDRLYFDSFGGLDSRPGNRERAVRQKEVRRIEAFIFICGLHMYARPDFHRTLQRSGLEIIDRFDPNGREWPRIHRLSETPMRLCRAQNQERHCIPMSCRQQKT